MIYQLTEQSLAELTEFKKLNEKTLTQLKVKLLGKRFANRHSFIEALKQCIHEIREEKILLNFLEKKALRSALLKWWDELEEIKFPDGTKIKSNRGERAKLRRCEKPEDILLQPYFYELQKNLPDNLNSLAVAAIAGLLAHIKKNNGENHFAKQLGQQKEQSGKAVFSELRFQQLLASRDIDELYENLRRAVMQLNRTANILSLADGVLHWWQEQHDKNQFDERPEQRFQFSWAKAYFSEVLTYSK